MIFIFIVKCITLMFGMLTTPKLLAFTFNNTVIPTSVAHNGIWALSWTFFIIFQFFL